MSFQIEQLNFTFFNCIKWNMMKLVILPWHRV